MCVYIYTVNTCIECIHFFSSALSTTGSPKWGIQTLLARKTGKKCKFVYLCVCMLLCVFHTCPLPDSSVWAHYLAQLKNMKAKYRRHKKNSFLLFEQFLGEALFLSTSFSESVCTTSYSYRSHNKRPNWQALFWTRIFCAKRLLTSLVLRSGCSVLTRD